MKLYIVLPLLIILLTHSTSQASIAVSSIRYEERAALICSGRDKTLCAQQSDYLKNCGVKLVEGKSIQSTDLKNLLAPLSSDVPVYIAAEGNEKDAERVSRLVGRRPSWIQICSRGENCHYLLSGISVPKCEGPFRKKKDRKTAMVKMTRLICAKDNFDAVDSEKKDGVLSGSEVNLFLTQELSGMHKAMVVNVAKDKVSETLGRLKKEEASFGLAGHSQWHVEEKPSGTVSIWREDGTHLCLADADETYQSLPASFHPFRSPWIDWTKESTPFISRDVDH